MISVQEALAAVQAATFPLAPRRMPLPLALGLSLSEDVFSPMNMPDFEQSAMDGYAFKHADWQPHQCLEIMGEVAAGDAPDWVVPPGQCARIFTGAPIPAGTDTVVQKEWVELEGGGIRITRPELPQGANVRLRGAAIQKGALALPKGLVLNAGGIGFLANLGFAEVPVVPAPFCTVIVTGNELCPLGQPLRYGQVYESNSHTLVAALKSMGISDVAVQYAPDDPQIIAQTLAQALEHSDMVLMTGGVSAGDYDFVVGAATACGVRPVFHKIKQKPGKPLFLGLKNTVPVFGLPGNPASVLTCFYVYVRPMLLGMMGQSRPYAGWALLAEKHEKKAGLTHFLKANLVAGKVQLLPAQESFSMRTFATANCLAILPEAQSDFEPGTEIAVIYL